ncbi:MAG: hypothetical protein Q9221_007751 [Calogaya cf. arnoldii]
MMQRIYSKASRVLIWLGESDKIIRKSMALLRRAAETEGSLPLSAVGNKRYRQNEMEAIRDQFPNELIEPFVPGLKRIFQKPWWFRLWVLQEVIVAKKPPLLGCGRKWVTWKVVMGLVICLGWEQFLSHEGFLDNPVAMLRLGTMPAGYSDHVEGSIGNRGRTLDNLLRTSCDRNATLPHDKIYALLGLTIDNAAEEIDVDYNQPYSVVYQQAMVHVLRSASNFNFLVQSINRPKGSATPSWCVDFSIPVWNKYSSLCGWPSLIDLARGFKGASGRMTKSTILHRPDQGTIQVQGTVVARIKQTYISTGGGYAYQRVFQKFNDLRQKPWDIIMYNLQYCKTGQRLIRDFSTFTKIARAALEDRSGKNRALEMLASGIICRVIAEGVPIPYSNDEESLAGQRYLTPAEYPRLEKYAQSADPDYRVLSDEWAQIGPSLSEDQDCSAWFTVHHLGYSLIDETLFTTDSGHLGKAPTAWSSIQEGDIACIIYGCANPVILRPHGQAYKVVTFAYRGDLMDGEYSDGSDRQTETFVLR